jgi:uncharacterized protein YqcC (DUF446 family)
MSARHNELANLLFELEKDLREAQLWARQSPPPEALLSTEPFSIDLLTFTEWLQFIFLPRMYAIIEAAEELPETCSIAPMAEQFFSAQEALGKSTDTSVARPNEAANKNAGKTDRKSIIRRLAAVDRFISDQ